MTVIKCPSCGNSVHVAEKSNTGAKWAIGCAIAAVAVPVVLAILGILAGMIIPAVASGRQAAKKAQCVGNMRQIDSAKAQWAMMVNAEDGRAVDIAVLNKDYFMNEPPECPKDGDYSYNDIGEDPECSTHGTMSDSY